MPREGLHRLGAHLVGIAPLHALLEPGHDHWRVVVKARHVHQVLLHFLRRRGGVEAVDQCDARCRYQRRQSRRSGGRAPRTEVACVLACTRDSRGEPPPRFEEQKDLEPTWIRIRNRERLSGDS